jgi:signal peptidase II
MRAFGARVWMLGALTLLVGCDHATKFAAKSRLEGAPPRELVRGVLDLHYVENRDVAFNLLRWLPEKIRGPALLVVGALGVLAIAALLLRRRPQRPLVRVALLAVLAGAIGNYADRLFRGYVVDFVHVHHWPVFNVADAYVTAGAALLGLLMLTGAGASPGRPPDAARAGAASPR